MRANELKIKDIIDPEEVQAKLNKELRLLEDRFVAVAMDYQFYMDSSWKEKEIFKLRNNLTYRMSIIHYHLKLLVLQEISIKNHLESLVRINSPLSFLDSQDNLIFGLYDSIIFHVCSLWDYVATITHFILGTKRPIKWSSLVKSVRDRNNPLSASTLAETLIKIDHNLLQDLYGYRSLIIHETAELGSSPITYEVKSAKVTPQYFTTVRHNNRIKHFKPIGKQYSITIKYAAFWIMFESIRNLTDILFSLDDYMVANQKVTSHFMFLSGKDGTQEPVSTQYWHRKEYPDRPTDDLGFF